MVAPSGVVDGYQRWKEILLKTGEIKGVAPRVPSRFPVSHCEKCGEEHEQITGKRGLPGPIFGSSRIPVSLLGFAFFHRK